MIPQPEGLRWRAADRFVPPLQLALIQGRPFPGVPKTTEIFAVARVQFSRVCSTGFLCSLNIDFRNMLSYCLSPD
jgi:hypothetical protein